MTAAVLPLPQASSHSRQLAISTFADERSTTPLRTGHVPWDLVVALHAERSVRPSKSGKMLGGYALNGVRSNENVLFRSIVQLDIDSQVNKDKATGRILEIEHRAPTLDDIRASIDQYEWVAASSHSHEPQHGIIKYRIVILPDRDIIKDEWNVLLEALDELLRGSLDRGAWQWSQAFYLPSCPAQNEADAFFVHNQGAALPVDEFVRQGREIIAARDHKNVSLELETKSICRQYPPRLETPEEVERVKSMLAAIPPDVLRPEWRQICWAVMATGWDCTESLIREWSMKGNKFTESDFAGVVRSFRPDKGTGFGSLDFYARKYGWSESRNIETEQPTGLGGDLSTGRTFARLWRGKLLYIPELADWLKFDPKVGWGPAPALDEDRAAKDVVGQMRELAGEMYKTEPDGTKVKRLMAHIERSSKLSNLRAMVETAKSEQGMSVPATDLDANPLLLGVQNGVLDLSGCKLLPPSPDILVSKRCNVSYDPKAVCPRFRQYLDEVQPDPKVQAFLLRFAGYCLTGEVSQKKFLMVIGVGDNGKTVFVELLNWLLGSYASKIETEMLMTNQRNPQGPSADIVALKGLRFVYANETTEGQRLADARIKDLTGGDTQTGRPLYAKAPITFFPTHKLVIVGNHKPDITDNSSGMWSRVSLVPFDQVIPPGKRDRHLLDKLKAEGSGILNLILLGYDSFRKHGLPVPQELNAATQAYREDQDIIGEWKSEHCNVAPGLTCKKADAYQAYKTWAQKNGHGVLSQKRFTRRLTTAGVVATPDKRSFGGIDLNPEAQLWAAPNLT